MIRTLEVLSSGEIICGPCNSVDHILKLNDAATINILVDEHMKDKLGCDGSEQTSLYLYPLDKPREDTIIHTGRVGLYMTKKNVSVADQANYVMRNYRSVAEPRKVSKGRHLMTLALLNDGKSVTEIAQITGMKEAVIRRQKDSFDSGKKQAQDLSVFAKRINDTVACECYGAIIADALESKKKRGKTAKVKDTEEKEEEEEAEAEEEENEDDVDKSMEENDEEDEESIVLDTKCLIPWIKWKIQESMKGKTKKKLVELHPFPRYYSNEIFGSVLDKCSKTTNISKGFCYEAGKEIQHKEYSYEVNPKDLEKILGADWWKLNAKKEIQGSVEISIVSTQKEGKLIFRFSM